MHELESALVALCRNNRLRVVVPFVLMGMAAIIIGGLIAAAVAHEPSRHWVWLAAYLVLVCGVAQCALGVGQALLAPRAPGSIRLWCEWGLFNLGSLAVIVGTMLPRFLVMLGGTLALLLALALFMHAIRRAMRTRLRRAYESVLAVVALGALVGLGLASISYSA